MTLFPILAHGVATPWPAAALTAGALFAYLLARGARVPATTRRALAFLLAFSLANLAAAFFPGWTASHAWVYVRVLALATLLIGLLELAITVTVDFLFARRGRPFPKIMRDTITLVLSAVVLFVVLREVLGVNLTSLLATSAVLSVVIGLALQDILGNFFSGLALQMERPLEIGDWVGVDAWIGEVSQVTWRSVKIRTLDNDEVTLPNSAITRSTLRNFSRPTAVHRHAFRVGAHYRHRPNRVTAAILEAARDVPGILAKPPVQVIVAEYGDSAIIYEVRFWIDDYPTHAVVAGDFQSKIWYHFSREGITIPFPIREVHVVPPSEPRIRDHAAILGALDRVDILRPLSEDEREVLAGNVVLEQYGRGERIIRQGDAGGSLFVILDGEVSIQVSAGREERQVSTLGPGDVFGEMSLLTGEPRTATVIATTDVTAVAVTKGAIGEVVAANPAVLTAITEILKGRRDTLESAQREAAEVSTTQPARHELLKSIRAFFGLS